MNVFKSAGAWALFFLVWGALLMADWHQPPLAVTQIPWGETEVRYQNEFEHALKVYARFGCERWAGLTATAASNNQVPAGLLAALVVVESTCDPDAVSPTGAIGLTQVQPRVWSVDRQRLRDPEFNLAIGASILSLYTQKYGLEGGLERYYGHEVEGSREYVKKVLRIWRRK